MWSHIKDDETEQIYVNQLKETVRILEIQKMSRGQEKVAAVFMSRLIRLKEFLEDQIIKYRTLRDEE